MMQPTPSQRAAMERHKSFHAAIAARAALANQPHPKAVLMQKSEPSIIWPVIPIEGVPEVIVKLQRPVHRIIRIVAEQYHTTGEDIVSSRRTKDVIIPRHVAIFFAKEMTLSSLPEIGRRFGGRDHTSILHAVRKITRMIENDPQFAARIDLIRGLLRA